MLNPFVVLVAAAAAFSTPDYAFTPPVGWARVPGRPAFSHGRATIGVAPVQLKGAETVAKVYLTNPELQALGSRAGTLGGRPSQEFEFTKGGRRFSAGCAVDFGDECLLFFLEYNGGPKPPPDVWATFLAAKASFRFVAGLPQGAPTGADGKKR